MIFMVTGTKKKARFPKIKSVFSLICSSLITRTLSSTNSTIKLMTLAGKGNGKIISIPWLSQ